MSVDGSLVNLTGVGGNIPVYYVVGVGENVTSSSNSSRDGYDAEGAMQFIICTVAVYSTLGVVCMLISGIKKKTTSDPSKMQDDAISKYLKKQRILNLEGYHTQLMSQCAQYTEKIRLYEEKMRLIEIEQEIQTEDFGLTQFTHKNKKRGKKERKKKNKKAPNTNSALGKLGFSLLYLPDRNLEGSRSDIEDPKQTDLEVIVEQQSELKVTVVDETQGDHKESDSMERTDRKVHFLDRQRSISL